VALGTATSDRCYTQQEMLEMYNIEDRRIRSVFINGGIKKRYLTLPDALADGTRRTETQADLLRKHREQALDMGARALKACLLEAGLRLAELRYICCVTSTGLLTPGLSALMCRELDLPRDCARLDVVGMGCNAGLNGLAAVSNWAQAHPGEVAVMLCAEVCSAAYVFDSSMESAVVNSLFGDGAAAVAVRYPPATGEAGLGVFKFSSHLIPEAIGAMRFNWDETHGKFNFFLDRDVPYVIGANAELAIDNLLDGTGLRRSNIAHWVLHSGGKKVIDSVRVNLGLTKHDVRHTMSVLSEYGNLSSGSFLFSMQRLLAEGVANPGDHGICMTMGPGSTIETALVQW